MSIVANFSITYTQILNPQGELVSELPEFAKDPKELLQLYRWMLLTRTFDAKAIALQRTGKIGTYPSTLGQEAVGVGLGSVMKSDDILCPAYREIGAQFQRGVRMLEILQYWGGDERGNCFANNKEDLPISVPIASQCLHAAGIAFAFNYRDQPRVAVTVCGDGATSEGDFYEAMNIAGAWNLPVLFVVINNQWAISLPRHQQTHAHTLAQKAIAAGFDGEQVDGNDIIAVRSTIENALQKIRTQKQPHLIEALTYRLHDHTTADDASRYRSHEEVEKAMKEEPLMRFRLYLTKNKILTDDIENKMRTECAEEVERAVQDYFALDNEPINAMFNYHFEKDNS